MEATVTKPARKEWPENPFEGIPARLRDSFKISLTDWSVRRVSAMTFHLSIGWKRGPEVMPETFSHSSSA